MDKYIAPLTEIFSALESLCAPEMLDKETQQLLLTEAARMAETVLGPLNRAGDKEGAFLGKKGQVVMPEGFFGAYQQFCEQGWASAGSSENYGGQPLSMVMMTALYEMFSAANAAFSLLPMLNFGTARLLEVYASDELKKTYLADLVSGKISAAMVLTEADAGSDMVSVRTRAEGCDDGTYRIFGQKQFISYGDHDLTENSVHLVLVRTSASLAGLRGLSLVLIPKICPDGSLNCFRSLGLEDKMGIHAAPTVSIQYGEGKEGALGYLIGKAGRGLEYFYSMMRLARFMVAVQSLGISEASFQRAVAYAKTRRQGMVSGSAQPVAIISHPDVVRMLSVMRMKIRAMRCGLYRLALAIDRVENQADAFEGFLMDIMIPAMKAFCSDLSVEVTSDAIQVFGGYGYMEDIGMPQFYRDARIGPIYEGTNGIQAIEVAIRRVARDRGALLFKLIDQIRRDNRLLNEKLSPDWKEDFLNALDSLALATQWMIDHYPASLQGILYSANDYLKLLSLVLCGWQMAYLDVSDPQILSDCRHYQDEMLRYADLFSYKIVSSDKRWYLSKDSFN